jgi:hypothetical protein
VESWRRNLEAVTTTILFSHDSDHRLVVWWVLKIRPAAFELNVAQREYEAHWGLKPTQERCYINTIGLRAWRPGELVMRWKSRDGNGDGDDGGRIRMKDEG